ncbi:ATP-binding protein [Nocardioides cynanchi]|uniref:ATP-binding protein n=1 Tax=Nocardioides cynanchi TaxID=2558918 RepID=UPI001248C48F|nr:SbcC/MukB-like Walker B domain-containing protein [Nocardioides cynanchi]
MTTSDVTTPALSHEEVDQPAPEPPTEPAAEPASGLVLQQRDLRETGERTVQWRAETFQLVNWGGFEGRVRFRFHPGATLISGASGTGKSTLLDAYIALMMPADTPFNGASNDAVTGRARGADQRNLLSYLRGKTDTVTDNDGRAVDHILRGQGQDSWGAVGMTFVNDHGQHFTALRAYYVPARATRTSDILMRMATLDDDIDLADLEALLGQSFAPKALRNAFPGLRNHDSYASFANNLYTRLGIGANGDGAKALKLLVRIQSGHQIRTVDELFKEMVLERPATYETADSALRHFDSLEASYLAMQTEQQKADLLGPVTEIHDNLVAAQDELETIDTVGLTCDGDTPLKLWTLYTEDRLLGLAAETNKQAGQETGDQLDAAKSAERVTHELLEQTKKQHRDSGGETLELLGLDIARATEARDQRLARRHQLVGATAAIDTPFGTADDFAQARQKAAEFEGAYPKRSENLGRQRDEVVRGEFPLLERRRDLTAERSSLEGRAGRVPKHLDDMRAAVAEAAGMDPADLPFLAELIDIPADESRWRVAIETVLGASARQMLVPKDRFEQFSAAIDPLRLRGRLTFVGVPLETDHGQNAGDTTGDSTKIAGKLIFRDTPFTAWVRRHVSDPGRNARCVETSDQLAGVRMAVTLAGQTRQGMRGSHGRSDVSNIIGFSNEDAIADIDAELADIERQLTELDQAKGAVDAQIRQLDRLRTAYDALGHYTFAEIDVDGAAETIRQLEADRKRILDADDKLQELQARIDSLDGDLEERRRARIRLTDRRDQLAREQETLVDRQDEVTNDVIRIEDRESVELTDAQRERLDTAFKKAAAPADPDNLDEFVPNLVRLKSSLTDAVATAERTVKSSTAELERIFAQYQLQWEDPNLSRTVESYSDYARILDHIVSTGLHERRLVWRQRLTEWSGQDLVPLYGAMRSAVQEIEERLHPINDILAGLPFGANRNRLRIHLRTLIREDVQDFTRQLRRLSSEATRELPEKELETRFKQLQQFMSRIRRREDPRYNPELADRDRLLDVRRHVEITAERYGSDGQTLSTHSALGGKSGGESQELVAFIVGAALRFRLGDEERARPRFAPVFLDEGFVKSDAEFAGRAVQAWKGLGFQLIVGAPLDKVTALEPHMDEVLAITKNTETGYSFVHRLRDPMMSTQ